MKLKKYLMLFCGEDSKSTVRVEGAARLLTSIAAVLAVASVIIMFAMSVKPWVFLIGVAATVIILAVNSLFEVRFNKVINSLIASEHGDADDAVSSIRGRCLARYSRYTDYIKRASGIFMIFSIVFAVIAVAFSVVAVFDERQYAFFVVAGIAVFVYSLVQMVYALCSFIKETEFFGDCKADMECLKKQIK